MTTNYKSDRNRDIQNVFDSERPDKTIGEILDKHEYEWGKKWGIGRETCRKIGCRYEPYKEK